MEDKNKAKELHILNTYKQTGKVHEKAKKHFKKLCRRKKRDQMEKMLTKMEENYQSKLIKNF